MKTFSQYFQQQVLIDRLPFRVDFELSPISSDVKETISGLEFSILNDLVSREEWFFSSNEALNSSKVKESSTLLRTLASKLKTALDLESIQEANEILWNGSEEYQKDPRYTEFYADHSDQVIELIEGMQLAQDTQAMDWFRVTFFILSRCTSEWSLSKTMQMRSSEIQEIISLIIKEANGGVSPDEIQDDNIGEVINEGEGK